MVNWLFANFHDVALHCALAFQMTEVSRNSCRCNHGHVQVKDAKITDVWIHTHQQGKRLAYTAPPATNAHFVRTCRLCILLDGCLGLSFGFDLCLGLSLDLGLWLHF